MIIEFNMRGVSAFGTVLPLDSKIEQDYSNWLPFAMKEVAKSRKQEFIAGRFCAVQAAKHIGYELIHLPSSVSREPMWPDGIKGSISHTRQMAIGCVSSSAELESIGIDVEEIIKPGLGREVEKVIAHDDEVILLAENEPDQGLTILFSAKEALYKALFPIVKSYIDFKEVKLIELNSKSQTFVLELVTPNPKLASHLGKYPGSYKKMGETIITIVTIPKNGKGKYDFR